MYSCPPDLPDIVYKSPLITVLYTFAFIRYFKKNHINIMTTADKLMTCRHNILPVQMEASTCTGGSMKRGVITLTAWGHILAAH